MYSIIHITQIYSTSTSNTLALQLTTSQEGHKTCMEPDGKQLAFTRYVEEKSQIFILSMEGGEPAINNF
jgi:Tol biopolymer transport system component